MLTGSEFHRAGVATEKGQVPPLVLTLGRNSKLELDYHSYPGFVVAVDNALILELALSQKNEEIM